MLKKVLLGIGAAVLAAVLVPSNAVAQEMAMAAPWNRTWPDLGAV